MKETPLLKHLRNDAFRDEAKSSPPAGDYDRLRSFVGGNRGGWEWIERLIDLSTQSGAVWFPDANVMFRDDTIGVWETLKRVAGRKGPKGAISTIIEGEARAWIDKPEQLQARAKAIGDALAEQTWLMRYGLPPGSAIVPAIIGYGQLFGLRRLLARATPDGMTLVDTDPADKQKTMKMISQRIGPRAPGLASKGRKDIEKTGLANINDEMHVLLAVSHALLTGTESVILTADYDLIEIFYKVQWMFDTHYRSYCAAPLVKAGTFGEAVSKLESTDGYFDGPLTLYRRPSEDLFEVLPESYRPALVSVFYVDSDDGIHIVRFPFEREMIGMLEMRAKTKGRCTDLFGECNIHVELGPLKRHLDGLYFGVGRDISEWKETNGVRSFLARLDEQHSMSCQERFAS